MSKFRTAAASVLVIAGMILPSASVHAAWPERPVKVIVPFAAGGITDVIARLAAERLREKFNQPFIIENEAGASGTIAAQRVARADPDGYTQFFSATNQISVAPFTHNIAYDPLKDFKPIALVGSAPYVFTVSAKVPAKTFPEFIAHVKANPGKVTYGSSGTGSLSHLASAHFSKTIGVEMVQVAYRGVGPAFQDLLAGHIDMMTVTPVELKPHMGAGKVRPQAVTDDKRFPVLPNVPPASDSIPSPPIVTWSGFLAPGGTAQTIVDAVAAELVAAGRDQAFLTQLDKIGVAPIVLGPREFAELIAADLDRFRDIVRSLGLKPPQ